MILITLGTQCQFDRLVYSALKSLKANNFYRKEQIIVQGNSEVDFSSEFPDLKVSRYTTLSKADYLEALYSSEFIISHVGVGTLVSCVKAKKNLFALAREAKYQEHRNDHQIDTAMLLSGEISGINLFIDEEDFCRSLESLCPDEISGCEYELGGKVLASEVWKLCALYENK